MIEETLAALADPTRRGVVELLRQEPRRAGELARALETSAPAMSRHLKLLRRAGLVEPLLVDEDARGRMYRLRFEPLHELRRWVDEVEQFWSGQLTAFQAHVEGTEEGPA